MASRVSRRARRTPRPTPGDKPSSKKLPELIATAVGEKGRGKRLEIWFQDEARIGQKGELTRQWAPRGVRPRQPRDQRYQAAYLFGAVCPSRGATASLVLPAVNAEAMSLHLAEISQHVAVDGHAVVILDQAGWHGAKASRIPDNLSLLPLPPYSPELNPIGNLWQFLRHNYLNARVFASYEAIVDACCDAWNRLRQLPDQIQSITTRAWAKQVTN